MTGMSLFLGKNPVKLASVGALLFLAACQTTSGDQVAVDTSSSGHYKVGKPYQIAGVWYYPKEQYNYNETGLASWYGDEFKGKKTANGEIYNPALLTAAHKTLPMPVMARVTNLENGNQIVVRINDRGPFVQGRIIDLSTESAKLLGFKRQGVAKVRVEYIGKAIKESKFVAKAVTAPAERRVSSAPVNEVEADELAPPPGASVARDLPSMASRPDVTTETFADFRRVPVTGPASIYVQAGSFQMRDNAIRLKGTLERRGYQAPGVEISTARVSGQLFYRVHIGPLLEVDAADQMLTRVLDSGYAGARIVIQ